MTELGVIHLLSLVYLSGVFCLAVSVNQNNTPKRALREALRRWAELLGLALIIAIAVSLLS